MSKKEHTATEKFAIIQEIESGCIDVKAAAKKFVHFDDALEAVRAVRFAFDELGLNRIFAAAMTRNPASYKVMEKIGMKHEGILRNHIRKGDAYKDEVLWSSLK